jgi:uncharacterized protein with FMN-binding domain
VRRAAAAVIGTVAGTSLLIAAKLGVHSPDAGLAADQATTVVDASGAPPAPGDDDDDRPASAGPAAASAAPSRLQASAAPTRTGGPPAPPAPAPTTAGTGLHNGTFTGPGATERYGKITVTVTVSGGRITDAKGACTGCQGDSVSISNNAFTKLRQEVLTAQSASVATVSGATYTSGAYKTSLQAAINAARA